MKNNLELAMAEINPILTKYKVKLIAVPSQMSQRVINDLLNMNIVLQDDNSPVVDPTPAVETPETESTEPTL